MKKSSVSFKKTHVKGLNIFYREAGDAQKPALLLLHGFPSSSHMFRDLPHHDKEDAACHGNPEEQRAKARRVVCHRKKSWSGSAFWGAIMRSRLGLRFLAYYNRGCDPGTSSITPQHALFL
jgi:pimeloyl-ACP methyl ester carboxylesterase